MTVRRTADFGHGHQRLAIIHQGPGFHQFLVAQCGDGGAGVGGLFVEGVQQLLAVGGLDGFVFTFGKIHTVGFGDGGCEIGSSATWQARRPIFMDFSCGVQSHLSSGTRSSSLRVVLTSWSNSGRRESLIFIPDHCTLRGCGKIDTTTVENIGRYRIIGELGRGAMGVVYKAQDPAIGRMIAVKSIRLGDLTEESERERLRERLFREAQSAGILSHPGIVTIYDIAEEGGLAYIFMELVNGPPLDKMLQVGADAGQGNAAQHSAAGGGGAGLRA